MHRDSGLPHWKLKQIQKSQKACGILDGQTDVNIILPLRIFYPVTCDHMCCAKIQAT